MKLTDLQFDYPEQLIAKFPEPQSRVMWVENKIPTEISLDQLVDRIPAGDILVLNDTKVLKRRVFAGDLEILFLTGLSDHRWEVLFPSKKYKVGDVFELPLGKKMKLLQKGRPQILQAEEALPESYFEKVGELPLPPYIQKARDQRHNSNEDESWYQTAWAQNPGSLASPTASLHFKSHHLESLKKKNVQILKTTLHVGLGTFLPVVVEDLNEHPMHAEKVEVTKSTWTQIQNAKSEGRKVWSLGTTTTRALESVACGLLDENEKSFFGETRLLIQPGYQFQVIDRLLTNFHQPESTLLALVSAFADLQTVKKCYEWAIEKRFRLFSYGDLSVWIQ